MGLSSSLNALADILDPTQAYWTIKLKSGKVWSEHSLVTTNKAGQKGFRLLDWGDDIVSTGDVHKVTEIRMHCPDGGPDAVLEIADGMEPFQFKARTINMLGAGGNNLEYMVIGRVTDKATGECECFIWDYRPTPEMTSHLLAFQTNIHNFGSWRDTVTPVGALSLDVQGFRL